LVAVGNDRQFQCFCNALGYTEWSADPKYATNSARVLNRQQLVEQIAGITLTRPKSYWIEALEKVNVPCGPINSVAEVFQDPQVISRQMQMTIEGNPSIASPLRLSETPVEYHSPPPTLGQHTGEVLTQVLGLSLSEMEELANSGVITIPQLPN
jgi:crotonobetainyl-CoA:carnitine CoA-transferase CaiB-like acyl-CoA transferase